jgi:hypothetical protein
MKELASAIANKKKVVIVRDGYYFPPETFPEVPWIKSEDVQHILSTAPQFVRD